MYRWRTLTDDERRSVLCWRQKLRRPPHSPPHIDSGQRHYLITAACYEHVPHIGHSIERMNAFAAEWLAALESHSLSIAAWVLLPNHYHALVCTREVGLLLKRLGRLHGGTAFRWNGEEGMRGRKVWFNAVETVMKSSGHFHATLNYVHHNPVKHGYARKWTEWHWSSAKDYLGSCGEKEALRLWKEHPIESYGDGWDDADL